MRTALDCPGPSSGAYPVPATPPLYTPTTLWVPGLVITISTGWTESTRTALAPGLRNTTVPSRFCPLLTLGGVRSRVAEYPSGRRELSGRNRSGGLRPGRPFHVVKPTDIRATDEPNLACIRLAKASLPGLSMTSTPLPH